MSTIKSSAENLTLNADGANNDVIIQSNGSTKVTVDGQNSRVGIGTASPASVLEISDASSPVLRVTDSDNSNTAFIQADGTNAAYFGTLTNHDVRIAPNNSTKVIIKTDGKVGLSTTSPAALLSLGQDSGSGDSAASSGIAFETSNDANMFQISTVGGANNTARGLKFSADGNEKMRMSADGMFTTPFQPAFLAQPASNQNNIALNTDVTIVLGTERFDQNADFASNTFTAPVTGRYQFNYTLRIDQIDSAATFFQMKLATSNRTLTSTFDSFTEADIDYFTFSGSDLVDMDANDTAYIVFRQQGGTQQADIDTEARFSGFLAC